MIRSTRGNIEVSITKALIKGISSDGGLYIFDEFPLLDFKKIKDYDYFQLSVTILKLFFSCFNNQDIEEIVANGYNQKFDIEEGVFLKKLKGCFILELFHGPTCAFKDMALNILPGLLRKAKQYEKENNQSIILTATSGDTGGATLAGFQNMEDIKVIVLYPTSGVSKTQEQQMLSYSSKNSYVIAIEGNFDDAQRIVKKEFLKFPFLTSANSINIGRLIPQVIYYIYSYLQLLKNNEIKEDESINVCVPTGNFGNILAAYIASKMGVKINKLLCASNKNNILSDFFQTGIYDSNREFYKTNSPAMDILVSSNLERLIYLMFGEKRCLQLMKQLETSGKYQITKEELQKFSMFYGDFCDEQETLTTIKKVYDQTNYLLDPHTAVAYNIYQKYCMKTHDQTKTIVVATASPFKFSETILQALQIEKFDESLLKNIPQQLLNYPNNKRTVWKKDEIEQKIDLLIKELL